MDYQGVLNKIYEVKQNNDTILSLKNCELMELPKEINELKHIEMLNLCNNKLKTIPKEIGELDNLKILFLDNNNLEGLPCEIGRLNLSWLTLNNNNLMIFQEEILYSLVINGLERIDLSGNPINNIPKEYLREEPQYKGMNLKLMIHYFIHHNELLNEKKTLLEENLNNKDVIVKLVSEKFNKSTKRTISLKKILIRNLIELQGRKKIFEDNASENIYTDFIVSLLKKEVDIVVKDQLRWSQSFTGKSPGSIDIGIFKNEDNYDEKLISICECFKLSCLDNTVITNHINKIFKYDANGLKENFMIIYCKSNSFMKLWNSYIEFINKIDYQYPLICKFAEEDSGYADIKIGFTEHARNDINIKLYHIFIDLSC